MKLSEAIRLGSLLRPQGFGFYLQRDADNIVSCALGAAAEAIGRADLSQCYIRGGTFNAFPILDHVAVRPCDCLLGPYSICHTISHLNDYHCWTRERIADWVETQEALEATELEAVPA